MISFWLLTLFGMVLLLLVPDYRWVGVTICGLMILMHIEGVAYDRRNNTWRR